jgi:hypothetical protein
MVPKNALISALAPLLCLPLMAACSGCGGDGNGDEDGDAEDDTTTDDTSGGDTPSDTPGDDVGTGDGYAFARTFGGVENDSAYAILEVDGGYVVAGDTDSFDEGGGDFWIVHTNMGGYVTAEQAWGGGGLDEARAMAPAPGGGWVVAGPTESFGVGGDGAMWVVAFGSDGAVDWQRTIEGGGAAGIAPAGGGGYFLVGGTMAWGEGASDVWVVKIDADGAVSWENTYGGLQNDTSYAVAATPDDGCAVAGWTSSAGEGVSDVLVLKLASDGSVDWGYSYGAAEGDEARAIAATADGGYVVAGSTIKSGTSDADMWVLKLDSSGGVDWQNFYGGTSPDRAFAVTQTSDDGYLVGGRTESFGAGGADMWILKLDSSGEVDWQRTFGSSYDEQARAVLESSDGFYVIAGRDAYYGASAEDMWLVKLDTDGNISSSCPGGMIDSPTASATATSVTPGDVAFTPSASSATAADTSDSPTDSSAEVNEQCRGES